MWWDHLPASVAFCDVETTGVGNHDRIVSFGGIGMISRDLAKGRPDLEYLYLVFDPGTANRRAAEQIHGFSDSALRLQDPFAVHAADIWRFLTTCELLVAHNAAFDIRFIDREMTLSGLPPLNRPVYCTMKGYRALNLGGSAALSNQHVRHNIGRRLLDLVHQRSDHLVGKQKRHKAQRLCTIRARTAGAKPGSGENDFQRLALGLTKVRSTQAHSGL
jgi:DNA polymerase III subunit epsilon